MFLVISGGDWLQSGASLLGALIAIWGVYWQVGRSSKNDKNNSLDVAIALKNLDEYVSISRKINSLVSEINYNYKGLYFDDSSPDRHQWKMRDDFKVKLNRILNEQFDEFKFLNSIYGYKSIEVEADLEEKISNIKIYYNKFSAQFFNVREDGGILELPDGLEKNVEEVEDLQISKEKLVNCINDAAIFINTFANKQIKLKE